VTRSAKKTKPAPRVRKPRVDGQAARIKLLDSAERLFAERGFFGTSVRDVTTAAGVRLASVNYHFRSKEELFRDVVLRRASVLNQDRLALLERARTLRGSREARLRALVDAFVSPLLVRGREGRGYRDYFALIAQVASSRLWVLGLVAEHFNALASRFIEALGAIYPKASPAAARHAYLFMLGTTLYAFSDNRRIDSLSQGAQRSDDFAAVGEELVRFLVGGIAAQCGAHSRGAATSVARRARRRV
jgi:AcrR family transcriptional regulator